MKSPAFTTKSILLGLGVIFCILATAQKSGMKEAALQWQNAMLLKDPNLIVSFFDTAVIAIYHNNPAVSGKAANLKTWERQFTVPTDEHPITVEKTEVASSGDIGYVFGKWWSIHPAKNYYNGGRYLAVWVFKNKEWKIAILSVNAQEDVKAEKNPN